MSVTVWYMRDNHTFLRLPLEVNLALQALEDEFIHGDSRGMLCSKHPGLVNIQYHSNGNWNDFKPLAVGFLREAMRIANAEGYDESK